MPLLDLSQVTYTLIRLLEKCLSQPHLWDNSQPSAISISGNPPDILVQQTEDYALSIYLYHVQEEGYNKNLPEPSGNSPPVRFREMGLNLFYLLTAHGGTNDGTPPYGPYMREQRLMGLALKAFHDYPVLDSNTRIGNGADPFVFPDTLRGEGDEFRLTLHPATLEEINKVWTAATVPMRLSAIYQVSVVLLKAEEPVKCPVPVLEPRIEVGDLQPLWIKGNESDCTFTLPGEIKSRTVTLPSALAAVGETFRILGFGFSATPIKVLLTSPTWANPPYVDVTNWIKRVSETSIELEVSSPVDGRAIVPGLYQVYVHCAGAVSNFSPLAIAPMIAPQEQTAPGIDPAAGPAGTTTFVIRGGPFSGTEISTLGVYLGTRVLKDEFSVTSESTIEVSVPADLPAGFYAVRVVVNGVSTLPTRWFEVT